MRNSQILKYEEGVSRGLSTSNCFYEKNIGKEISGSYYDRPWYYSSNREVNFFVRIDLN